MSRDALIVEMRNVSRKYRFFSLQDVSLTLASGQIMGLVPADSGEVRVFGHSMKTEQALAKSRVIAGGSVAEMRALVSRRQINCDSRFSAEEIRTWPGVIEVIRDEQRLHITAIDAEAVVRRLLAADSNLRNLEVRQAGLNEAFTQLTKEAA